MLLKTWTFSRIIHFHPHPNLNFSVFNNAVFIWTVRFHFNPIYYIMKILCRCARCRLFGANPTAGDEARKGFPSPPYDERLRRLRLLSLGRRRLCVYKMFTGGLDLDPRLIFLFCQCGQAWGEQPTEEKVSNTCAVNLQTTKLRNLQMSCENFIQCNTLTFSFACPQVRTYFN